MTEEEKQAQAEVEHENQKRDMASLLKTTYGRNVLWRILHMCQVYATNYGADGHSAFTDGKRHVGIQLIALLQEVHPAAYADLMREMALQEYEKQQAAKANEENDENFG